jgi:hypothetical protein
MKVIFDVLHLYYLPQYLPVYQHLTQQGHEACFVFFEHTSIGQEKTYRSVIDDLALPHIWLENQDKAFDCYKDSDADWILFNNEFLQGEALSKVKKVALMEHGIGPKACYYDKSETPVTVRFVEGQHRLDRLQTRFPTGNFIDTGFAKLDPALNNQDPHISLSTMGLEENKKTILYAPTFYPSSLMKFEADFPAQFSDFNIILKPHSFSLCKKRYADQKNRLTQWQSHSNVYLASEKEFNLVPFMQIADIMLSDASSAIFEFAALQKPIVWCNFYHLRWSYRGIFAYRFKQRMDDDIEYFAKICQQADRYCDIRNAIESGSCEGDDFKAQKQQLVLQLAGKTDGKASERIVEYLLNN